jgi:Flp pilus assembly protein TadD
LADRGQVDEAVAHYREAIRLKPEDPKPYNNLAWTLATHPDRKVRDGAEAVELAERGCTLSEGKDPNLLDTLAAAFAELGRFAEAVETAQRAISLAASVGSNELVSQMENRLRNYRQGRPYRETRPVP